MATQHRADPSLSAPELRQYLDAVWQQLPAFARHAAALPADERGSFEWLAAAGQFWRRTREQAGVDREHAARLLGCSVNRLRLMEFGLLTPHAFSNRRLRTYAQQLGDARAFEVFREQFER